MRRGTVGKVIDDVSNKIGLNAKILRKPLVGKKASDYMAKSKLFPWKGVAIASTVAGVVSGPLAPITAPLAAIKRWRSSGEIHPIVRAIGRKK